MKTMINGLFQTRTAFNEAQQKEITGISLKLVDRCEKLKPHRSVKICLEAGEVRLILLCLNEWRNRFIAAGKADAADGVGEVMMKLAK